MLQELVHEGHVLFFVTKPARKGERGRVVQAKPPPEVGSGSDSLGEVGQVLRDLGDERECARRAVVGVLLHQVEERGRHDGGAEEAQEQGGADQALADVRTTPVAAFLSPRRKHLLQFPWKHTEERKREKQGPLAGAMDPAGLSAFSTSPLFAYGVCCSTAAA